MVQFNQYAEAQNALSGFVVNLNWTIACIVALVIASFAIPNTAHADRYPIELTQEQLSLLSDTIYVPAEDIDAFNQQIAIPLLTLTLSASRQTVNTDQFEILASYNSMGFTLRNQAYLVEAPAVTGLDFSASIKRKCQESPQQFIDNMIVDGALGFNVNW